MDERKKVTFDIPGIILVGLGVGAIVFGRLGDLVGRKYTFLVTLVLMGGATFLIGLLPDYDTIGIFAPVLLVALRLVQGLALGGEYGGAAIYVAEHATRTGRGAATAGIQVDDPAELADAVADGLLDGHQVAREAALDIVYAYRSGAALRAAEAIREWAA